MASNKQDTSEDGILIWAFLILLLFGLAFAAIWFAGHTAIVYHFSVVLNILAIPWSWIPLEYPKLVTQWLAQDYQLCRSYPASISLGSWLHYASLAFTPWVFVMMPATAALLYRQAKYVESSRLQRKFKPAQLSKLLMKRFPNIAPTISIQKQLVDDKLPGWRRQTFPEELLKASRINGKPVIVNNAIDRERLNLYLQLPDSGMVDPPELEGRRHVRMLGRQMIDLPRDGGKKGIIYPDRFSGPGKVLFAILASYAFGDAVGRSESKHLRDALNRTSFGSKTGMANLSIPEVTLVFNKYRNHPLSLQLFGTYRWEYTYLFELLNQARKNGKIGTEDFLWLKPTDRIMFYVLDTEGRKTPPAEAALTFAQHAFEKAVTKAGRLPLVKNSSTGLMEHVVFTETALDAFEEEWKHYFEGIDDDDSWWKDKRVWDIPNSVLQNYTAPVAPAAAQDTHFDQISREQQTTADVAEDSRLATAARDLMPEA